MNQMYFDEPFSGSMYMNLFCRGGVLTKQIFIAEIPHFDVHRSTSVHQGVNFSYSLAILMNQMHIDVLLVVYGGFFAMGYLNGEAMYFSAGEELHRSTFGSSRRPYEGASRVFLWDLVLDPAVVVDHLVGLAGD